MIELYGLRYNEEPGVEIHELVATFDTVEAAKDYIENSLLKAAKKDQYFRADPYRGKFKYRKNSLLRYYEDHEIEGTDRSFPPPHNPTLED